jgi:hypothetical protein
VVRRGTPQTRRRKVVKAKNLGRTSVVGGWLALIMIATILGCSALAGSANPASDPASSSPSIFEKGKTYRAVTSALLGEVSFTVLEMGPQPWLKVRFEKGEERWLNTNQIITVEPQK